MNGAMETHWQVSIDQTATGTRVACGCGRQWSSVEDWSDQPNVRRRIAAQAHAVGVARTQWHHHLCDGRRYEVDAPSSSEPHRRIDETVGQFQQRIGGES